MFLPYLKKDEPLITALNGKNVTIDYCRSRFSSFEGTLCYPNFQGVIPHTALDIISVKTTCGFGVKLGSGSYDLYGAKSFYFNFRTPDNKGEWSETQRIDGEFFTSNKNGCVGYDFRFKDEGLDDITASLIKDCLKVHHFFNMAGIAYANKQRQFLLSIDFDEVKKHNDAMVPQLYGFFKYFDDCDVHFSTTDAFNNETIEQLFLDIDKDSSISDTDWEHNLNKFTMLIAKHIEPFIKHAKQHGFYHENGVHIIDKEHTLTPDSLLEFQENSTLYELNSTEIDGVCAYDLKLMRGEKGQETAYSVTLEISRVKQRKIEIQEEIKTALDFLDEYIQTDEDVATLASKVTTDSKLFIQNPKKGEEYFGDTYKIFTGLGLFDETTIKYDSGDFDSKHVDTFKGYEKDNLIIKDAYIVFVGTSLKHLFIIKNNQNNLNDLYYKTSKNYQEFLDMAYGPGCDDSPLDYIEAQCEHCGKPNTFKGDRFADVEFECRHCGASNIA